MNKKHLPFLRDNLSVLSLIPKFMRFGVMTIVLLTMEGLVFTANAQRGRRWPISIGFYSNSNNVLTHDVSQLATWAASIPLTELTGRSISRDIALFHLHYMSLEDNGEAVDSKVSNPYGLSSYDLFNSFEWGLKIGWRGPESILGIYATGGYGINQYKFRFLGEREYNKHKLQSWRGGLMLNMNFGKLFWEDFDWGIAPFVEIGTTYVYNFKYKGPNDNNIDQINNGIRMNYALGAYIEDFGTILLKLDVAHYDLFNKNYTPDGGFWYPYANFKNKDLNFFIGFRTTW